MTLTVTVESMRQFVAQDTTDGSVVQGSGTEGFIKFKIKTNNLKKTRRKSHTFVEDATLLTLILSRKMETGGSRQGLL